MNENDPTPPSQDYGNPFTETYPAKALPPIQNDAPTQSRKPWARLCRSLRDSQFALGIGCFVVTGACAAGLFGFSLAAWISPLRGVPTSRTVTVLWAEGVLMGFAIFAAYRWQWKRFLRGILIVSVPIATMYAVLSSVLYVICGPSK